MQIKLDQKDIERAILGHLVDMGLPVMNRNIHIQVTMGKELGALIDICDIPIAFAKDAVLEKSTGACGCQNEKANLSEEDAPVFGTPASAAAVTSAVTATATKEEATTAVEDIDRESMKKQLDELGIEYAPKAHTTTLQNLLETALAEKAAKPAEEVKTEDPSSLFGNADSTETKPAEERQQEEPVTSLFGQPDNGGCSDPPPFDLAPETKDAPVTEEDLDDKPLFGV